MATRPNTSAVPAVERARGSRASAARASGNTSSAASMRRHRLERRRHAQRVAARHVADIDSAEVDRDAPPGAALHSALSVHLQAAHLDGARAAAARPAPAHPRWFPTRSVPVTTVPKPFDREHAVDRQPRRPVVRRASGAAGDRRDRVEQRVEPLSRCAPTPRTIGASARNDPAHQLAHLRRASSQRLGVGEIDLGEHDDTGPAPAAGGRSGSAPASAA